MVGNVVVIIISYSHNTFVLNQSSFPSLPTNVEVLLANFSLSQELLIPEFYLVIQEPKSSL